MLSSLGHVALAGVTAIAWLGLGSLLLAPLGRSGARLLDAVNRFGAGALAFALLTFAAGWARVLYAEAYLAVLVPAAAVGAVWLGRLLRGVRLPSLRGWELALAALLGVYVLAAVVVTCAPISSADALYYHAAAPELFEQRHRLVELPWSWHSYQPFTVELLVTDGFLLWDEVQGAFAALLLALGGLAAVVGAARELGGRRVALLAGAIFFAQPLLLWLATSTFVEPGLAFMVALAGWNVVRFARGGGDSASLALAGLFAGGAAGMKYVGAAAAAVLAVAAAVWLRRRLTARRVLAFAVPALAVALPWYVKNWILTGNPVYPFVFGGANPEAVELARASFEEYGHGRSALDLLLLPIRLLADAEAFDRGEFASPLVLLFAPVALLAVRARRAAGLVLGAGAVYALLWFAGSQQVRFLLPAMAAFAVLAALGVLELAARGRAARLVAVSVTAGALALGLAISAAYASQFVPVAAGLESRDEFLRTHESYYEGTAWLNRNLPADARVALGHVFALHVDRPTMVLSADLVAPSASAAEARAVLDRYGITHVARLGRPAPNYLGARRIATLTVHPVTSRTLSDFGPPETLSVYAFPQRR